MHWFIPGVYLNTPPWRKDEYTHTEAFHKLADDGAETGISLDNGDRTSEHICCKYGSGVLSQMRQQGKISTYSLNYTKKTHLWPDLVTPATTCRIGLCDSNSARRPPHTRQRAFLGSLLRP